MHVFNYNNFPIDILFTLSRIFFIHFNFFFDIWYIYIFFVYIELLFNLAFLFIYLKCGYQCDVQ